MKYRPSILGVALALSVASTGAAGEPPSPVSVESAGATLSVRVASPTGVGAVLEALCGHTRARCLLPPGTTEIVVRAGEFTGSWTEVIAQVLRGSGLGYAAASPAPGHAAYLRATAAVQTPSTEALPVGADVAAPRDAPEGRGSEEVQAGPARLEPRDIGPAGGVANATAGAASATDVLPLPGDGTLILEATGAGTVAGPGVVVTPFSDTQGNPLLMRLDPQSGGASSGATAGLTVLPFSDSHGKPMVVPISAEPMTLTPFANPDGTPWLAPPAHAGQTLQYPIPPSPPQGAPKH